MWKQFDDAAISAEDKAVRSLKKFFQGQQKRVIDNISDFLSKSVAKADIKIGEIMDFSEENKILLETLDPIWLQASFNGFEVANTAFEFGLTWDVVRDEWLVFVDEFGLEEAELINGATRDELQKIVNDGIAAGDSNLNIRDAITDKYSQYKSTRSIVIARTETHMATVGGTFTTYQVAGIEQKEWLTTIDGREREWHQTMDGQIKPINEPFISGNNNELMFPGDPNAPADEVIQCRCALLPIV